jgi:Na+-driven multidrug efflux pump
MSGFDAFLSGINIAMIITIILWLTDYILFKNKKESQEEYFRITKRYVHITILGLAAYVLFFLLNIIS